MPPPPADDANALRQEESGEPQAESGFSSVWEATAQSLSDAAAAISEASSVVAAKAMEIGAAGADLTIDAAKHIADKSNQAFSATGLSSAVEYLDNALEERGIKDAIADATEAVGDKLDQVTGKQLVEMLEAKLRRQDEYNDIMATRLAEALQRIAALEKTLAK